MKTESKYDDLPRVWVLIPMETKAREYHAKLLLSCVAAEAGFGVILGRKGILEFNARFLPRGILIGNNIVTERDRMFARYRKMGYVVAAWCEEGIAYRNRESYRLERVSPGAIRQARVFFAWGDYHAEDVRRVTDLSDHRKIVPSGNPRLDLLRPEFREFYRDEADKIRARHGRIVLVNTNFHRFNHFLGRGAYLQDLKKKGKVPTGEREAFFQQWVDFLERMYGAFSRMLRPLSAALPNHTIVVRPHPSEDHDAWREETRGLSNVKVLHEGSSLPWILSSEVVVHNSCATGIEAFAMDVPVVSYRPFSSETYDSFLPNAVSRQAVNENDLVSTVRALTSGEEIEEVSKAGEKREMARRFFGGLEGPLASENIVDSLRQLRVRPRPFAPNRIHALARELAVRTVLPVRASFRKIVHTPHPQAAYFQQKFPPLSLSEVRSDVNRLGEISGRFKGVQAFEIGETLFCLTSPERK
jgi:surface carbohydrate biosynthesis protein